MDWDERSAAGRYVRDTCKPLNRYIEQPDNEDHRNLFDLIFEMLKYEPNVRITLAEALDHPFFNQLPAEQKLHKIDLASPRSRSRRQSSCSDRSSISSHHSSNSSH